MQEADSADLTIIGAGTYGPVIAELAGDCGYRVSGFLDDDPSKFGEALALLPIRGPIAPCVEALPRGSNVAVAVGNNELRIRLLGQAQRLGHRTPSLISPCAVVSPTAVIEEACYLHAAAHVWTRAWIGMGTIMSPQSSVAHHSTLGRGNFVSTNAHIGASVEVGDRVFFGMSSTTATGVHHVASDSLLGAGTVLIRDTSPGGVYVGVPGRLLKHIQR